MKDRKVVITMVLVVLSATFYLLGLFTYRHNLFPLNLYYRVTRAQHNIEPSPTHSLEGKELLASLQRGGYVIFFRHATRKSINNLAAFDTAEAASKKGIRHPTFREGHCLSKEGMAETWLLREVFTELKIPVGRVISSPICRCIETAKQAFGRVDEINQSLIHRSLRLSSEIPMIQQQIKQLLAASQPGTNVVIVGHGGALAENGIRVKMAGAAIFVTDEQGVTHYVAKMRLVDWVNLLERKPIVP